MIKFVWSLMLAASLGSVLAVAPACATDAYEMARAVQLDKPVMLKGLLNRGGSPNSLNPANGEPLLVVAAREGADQAADALLAHPELQLELRAPNGNTALMMAAFKSNKPLVLKLLAKGALVTYPGWTPLHYAAAGGSTDIVAILLEHHAYIDAESPSQLTPLMLAAREGQENVVAHLLAAGADATLRNNEKLNASQIAKRADKPRIAAMIDRHVASLSKGSR